MVSTKATKEEIEASYRNKAQYYDPDITGKNDDLQTFEELKLAYETLMDDDKREEYDDYLSSLGYNRTKEHEEIDPEEVERRRRERGKKRFMEDFDFANDEFFNMFKKRTGAKGGSDHQDGGDGAGQQEGE